MNEEEKKKLDNIKYRNEYSFCTKMDLDFVLNLIEKLQKDNEELKVENSKMRNIELASKNGMVKITLAGILDMEEKIKNSISVQKVKDKIEHYQKLQDNYIEKYDEINEGLQAMINALQELLEGRK